jgi:hypothetical protein
VIKNCIASYANVFTPRPKMNATDPTDVEYSVQIVIPKNHPQLDELKAAIGEIAAATFPKLKLAPQGGPVKVPLRDADAEGKGAENPFLEGKFFFNARSQYAPQVVDGNLRVLTDESEFFSGCRMNCSISLYGYDTAGSKGVGVALNNIQRIAFGPRLDNRKSATDEFAPVEEEFEQETATEAEVPKAATKPAKAGKPAAPSVSW